MQEQKVVFWRVTSVSSNAVAPFGGDSLDPHQWAVLSRDTAGSLADGGGKPGTIGMLAAFAIILCVSIGWCGWKALMKSRAGRRERVSERSVASNVLPRIERLRHGHLSGAPVPARRALGRKWLVATARRFVAQLAYFRKPENPDPTAPHETRDHTA